MEHGSHVEDRVVVVGRRTQSVTRLRDLDNLRALRVELSSVQLIGFIFVLIKLGACMILILAVAPAEMALTKITVANNVRTSLALLEIAPRLGHVCLFS